MSSSPDSERWARLERLFHEASERPPESRDAFLADACADDPELLAQVREMLLHEGFKLPNVFTGAESLLDDEGGGTMPERVGSYQIERELGRGGMGVVYLGVRHRDDFEHQVAIKMLPSAPYDPIQLGRFQNERRILASLQHPGIARLLDGGTTESGIPYVVMDFVDGDRIDDYCDRADVTLDDRLRLFSRVMRGGVACTSQVGCPQGHQAQQHLDRS